MSPVSREEARRRELGLRTLDGAEPGGFFIPCRYAAAAQPISYPEIEAEMAAAAPAYRATLDQVGAHGKALAKIGRDDAPPAPRWGQDWFPRLDAAVAYTMVRDRKPRLVIEVGSGHSTRFLARAIADGGLDTRLVAIDPAPRADLARLPVECRRETVQSVGVELFRELSPGDLLLIDSSHVLMPGSDVDWLLNRVLPQLPRSIRLHLHDIFLPDPYPADWAWRGYNEQNAVAGLLTNGWYRSLFAAHYVKTRLADAFAASALARLPLMPGAHESGLWLEKR